MEPTSVMFFLPALGSGGAEMNAVRLAEGLMSNGIRPMYAVTRGPGPYAEHLPCGVNEFILRPESSSSSTVRLVQCVLPLARLIDEYRPDFLCPVMVRPAVVAMMALKLARHKPRIVISVQNVIRIPKGGGRSGFKNAIGNAVEFHLARAVMPRADRIIALSYGVRSHLEAYIPGLSGKIDVVHNIGVPLHSQVVRIDEQGVPVRTHRIRFLACGRLTAQKNFAVLLDEFSKVVVRLDAELHILGEGPLLLDLQRRAVNLGIEDRVCFLGFRANPFIHMEAADVFVLSSLWEGFANVVVEAMAMGVPVIANNCSYGPSEIIRNSSEGILVDVRDAGSLANAMLRLGTDKSLRQTISTNGRVRAENFAASKIAAQFAKALNDCITR